MKKYLCLTLLLSSFCLNGADDTATSPKSGDEAEKEVPLWREIDVKVGEETLRIKYPSNQPGLFRLHGNPKLSGTVRAAIQSKVTDGELKQVNLDNFNKYVAHWVKEEKDAL